MSKNDKFWHIADLYESKKITLTQAYDEFVKINNGNINEAKADMELLLKRS